MNHMKDQPSSTSCILLGRAVARYTLRPLKVAVVVFCMFMQPLAAQPQHVDPVPGVVIVKYESHAAAAGAPAIPVLQVQQVQRVFSQLDAIASKRSLPEGVLSLGRVYRLRYASGLDPREAARLIASQPGVEYAEPWYPRSPSVMPYGGTNASPIQPTTSITPDDPLFADDYYMRRMRMTDAWDVVKGEDSTVVIAIVDGGTDWRHEDLRSNVWINPGEIDGNGIDDDGNGFVDDIHGWNFANDSPDPSGLPGQSYNPRHGTLVAGIAAAATNNAIGMAGTSWNAKFMPVNVSCDDQDAAFCYTLEGMLYAAANGADVITASFAGYEYYQTEAELISSLEQMGALVVAGAGNEGVDMERFRFYPAAFQSTLSVCGTRFTSDINRFNYGYTVDVCAAGVDVLGTIPNNQYDTWYGTSFSVPQVAGIAALVKTAFPEFTPVQVREQLRATADNIDALHPPEYAGRLGRGRVNAYRAVTEADAISVRLTDWTLSDADGNGHIEAGELVRVSGTLTNLLADVDGLTIEMSANSPQVNFVSGRTTTTGPIASGASHELSFSFRFTNDLAYKSLLFLVPIVSADGKVVSGSDAIWLVGRDTQVALHETFSFHFDMTSDGNIGYVDFGWLGETDYPGETGVGFVLGSTWSTTEAGLIVGAGDSQVSASVLQHWEGYVQNTDFTPVGPMEFSVSSDGIQRTRVTLSDSAATSPVGLRIIQQSVVDSQIQNSDVALLRYELINPSDMVKENVHVGLYFDWQLGEWWNNAVGYDALERVLYTRSTQPDQLMGITLLTPGISPNARSYTWAEIASLRESTHLWPGLSKGVKPTGVALDNWAQLLGAGPISIGPRDTVAVDLALVYAESLPSLRTSAQIARSLWQSSWDIPPRMQLVQAVSDADLDVYLDGNLIHDDWPFPSATNLKPLGAGDHRLEIVAANESDNSNPLATLNVNFGAGSHNHVMIFGSAADPQLLVVEDLLVLNAAADSIDVYVAHGASSVEAVNLRLVRPESGGGIVAVLAENLVPGSHGIYKRVMAANYRLEVIAHGTGDILETFAIDLEGLSGNSASIVLTGTGTTAAEGLHALTVLPSGELRTQVSTEVSTSALPTSLVLHGNYPNPFVQSTNILFDLSEPAIVTITVYDLLGRKVVIGQTESRSAGAQQTMEISGDALSSGIYFYRLEVDSGHEVDTRYGSVTRIR